MKEKSPVKMTSLHIEDVKRVKVVDFTIEPQGLMVIGGKNGQGKSSILDAIAWTLGGDRYKPSNPTRAGADKLWTKITLTNGMIVERYGKNGSLRVTARDGFKGGQKLLEEFVNHFALNVQSFMDMSDKDKAKHLLNLLGIDLSELDQMEAEAYQKRTEAGRELNRIKAYYNSLPEWPDAPKEEISVSDIASRLREAIAINEGIQKAAERHEKLTTEIENASRKIEALLKEVENLKKSVEMLEAERAKIEEQLESAQEIDTKAIEAEFDQVEQINKRVRENKAKAKAAEELEAAEQKHKDLDYEVQQIRLKRTALLDSAKMSLPDLTIEDGVLLYRGQKWDCMSHSEQLRVAVAIAQALRPECGFVLLDKAEAMDLDTLKEFGEFAAERGLQIITTRVSTGPECSIIIEDGKVMECS